MTFLKNDSLQNIVEKISLESFNKEFKHSAKFNKRLRTTGGRYNLATHDIEINPRMLTEHNEKILYGVIKHELCHYHLHLSNRKFQHKDRDFKDLLTAVDGLRFAPASKLLISYTYVCCNCQQVYTRKRKIDLKKYVCSKCHGKLKLQND